MPYIDRSAWRNESSFCRRVVPIDIPRMMDEFLAHPFSGNRCYFCRKKLNDIKYKMITVKRFSEKLKVCSNCDYLFRTIYREFKSKNGKIIPKIYDFIRHER